MKAKAWLNLLYFLLPETLQFEKSVFALKGVTIVTEVPGKP